MLKNFDKYLKYEIFVISVPIPKRNIMLSSLKLKVKVPAVNQLNMCLKRRPNWRRRKTFQSNLRDIKLKRIM